MKRRSVFADKLKAFDAFVFGDDEVTKHRGAWCEHFTQRRRQASSENSPPLAGVREAQPYPRVGGGGEGRAICEQENASCSSSPHPNPLPEGEGTRPRDVPRTSSLLPPPSSLLLELGCFDGTFLARIASKHPNTNFVGLDWKARPLYLGAEQIAPMNLANLALLRARAQDITHIFADGELDEIWLLHPEPCDRENERANRLMSEPFLIDAHRLLRKDGRLILKTDHEEYFRFTLALMRKPANECRFTIEFESSDYWSDVEIQKATADVCLAGERTFYESRFVRRRQPIYYLQIRRK